MFLFRRPPPLVVVAVISAAVAIVASGSGVILSVLSVAAVAVWLAVILSGELFS